MKNITIGIFLLIFGFNTKTFAQLVINEPAELAAMTQKFEELNRSKTELNGWRIQLTATTDRRSMERTMTKFKANFPYMATFWSHKSPHYFVKAGAFYSRKEALAELEYIKTRFSRAYLVMDKVSYSEILQ